jgi:hypothetical protein
MAEAQAELDEATVEPRVEGLKLRFERESCKLRCLPVS